MYKELKSSSDKGNLGMSAAIHHYTSNGYRVAIPLTDTQAYDILIEMNGKVKKVQVKTTFRKCHKRWLVDLRTNDGRDKKKNTICQVDEVFILDGDRKCHVFTSRMLRGKGSITL